MFVKDRNEPSAGCAGTNVPNSAWHRRGGGALPFGFDKLNPSVNYPIIVQYKRLWESGDLPKPFYFGVFF